MYIGYIIVLCNYCVYVYVIVFVYMHKFEFVYN